MLRPKNTSRDIVLQHLGSGDGQLLLAGSADVTLDSATQWITLIRNGNLWQEVEPKLKRFTANVDADDNILYTAAFQDTAEVTQSLETISSNTDINLELGNAVTCTITGNLTFAFSNPAPSGRTGMLFLTITNGGAYTVTWPTSVKWDTGTAPTLQSAGTDIITFVTDDAGTTWRGTRFWRQT